MLVSSHICFNPGPLAGACFCSMFFWYHYVFRFSHTVPPRIIEELSPSTVICQKQSPCFLSCQATSYIPFNYSWTKDGQLPTGDNIKLMNNSLIVSPQVGEDYGEYVCHVTNTFGSTLYEITLLDCEGRYFFSHFGRDKIFRSKSLKKS